MPYCLLKTNPVCIFNDKRKGGKGDCRIYEDRPFLCRAFPVGIDKGKYFLETSRCKGIGKGKEWKVEEYLKQETKEYYDISMKWLEFLKDFKENNKELSEQKMLDFVKICYDFDNSFMKTFAE